MKGTVGSEERFHSGRKGLTADQWLNPPKVEFNRQAGDLMDLHSSSREELDEQQRDLAYRSDWLQAVLDLTDQNLMAVRDALAKMPSDASGEGQ